MTLPRRSPVSAPGRLIGHRTLWWPRKKFIKRLRLSFQWAASITSHEWYIYTSAIEAMRAAGVRFLLGGGFALAAYTGRWRDTKDIDFYIMPEARQAAVACLSKAGFADYYSRVAYDRKWIHRNVRSDMIVDLIWAMANQRTRVDSLWFERAQTVSIRGRQLGVIPIEEMLWCKLYIMQRDHCDWTDIFNLLYARGKQIDWTHLLHRLDGDLPLLKAMLGVYGWLCPAESRRLPIWRRLGMPLPENAPSFISRERMSLLDSRAWFAARLPRNEKLEV